MLMADCEHYVVATRCAVFRILTVKYVHFLGGSRFTFQIVSCFIMYCRTSNLDQLLTMGLYQSIIALFSIYLGTKLVFIY